MRFSTSILTLSLLGLAVSSPMPKLSKVKTSSATTVSSTTATDRSVLTASTYNAISISGGTAGTAEAEANALFSAIDQTNLAGVSAADLKVIKGTHDAAEDAEVEAFNPAIDAATGDAATALQVRSYSLLRPTPLWHLCMLRWKRNVC
jgi:hypothetical protein